MVDYRGQHVIVTGGTRGIGGAISRAFFEAGAEVTATFHSDRDTAESFRSGFSEKKRIHLAQFDVADPAAVEHFFGQLTVVPQVVVHNAGIRRDAIVGLMSQEDWRRVLAVNLDGAFFMNKYAVMAMSRQRYGRIIHIVSPSASLGFEGQANYAASKAGQIAMVKVLSKEVARRKITVNCVSPGFIDTDLLADISDEQKKAFVEQVPLKRFGTGEDVAHAVLFLASKEAGYITGATLEVTGGL